MSDTTSRQFMKLAGAAGFVLGAVLLASALSHFRIPRGSGMAGADISVIAQASGELAVAPTGAVVETRDLSPGEHDSGSFWITNQTGKALTVRLRVLPDSKTLDGLLQVSVTVDGRELFTGPLGRLRLWSAKRTIVPVRGHSEITFRVWFPATVPSGWQGQVESVPIELQGVPVTGVA